MAEWNKVKENGEKEKKVHKDTQLEPKGKEAVEDEDARDIDFLDDDFQMVFANPPAVAAQPTMQPIECNMVLHLLSQYQAFLGQPSS